MEGRRGLSVVLVVALLGQAFSVPLDAQRLKRGYADNELDSQDGGQGATDLEPADSNNRPTRDDVIDVASRNNDEPSKVSLESTTTKPEFATPVFDNDDSDEDDDDFEPMSPAPSAGGGSNIFSLLRLANALFPSSSGANSLIRNLIRGYFKNQLINNGFQPNMFNPNILLRRQDIGDNVIEIDEIQGLKPPPFQRQETDENDTDEDTDSDDSESDENDASEESDENGNGNGGNGNGESGNGNGNNASKPKSGSDESNGKISDEDDDDDDFSDEPPEGDGQGGGILGIIAGLSGGEDGQSDLGSLLATISGIVANLSGDGFDLNALIATGIGLFVGILSGGDENPGEIIASYLLTSLDTITGGGSKNNGAFFGKFISKLIRGTSAGIDPDASSEENGQEPPKDSAGFLTSYLMALLGDMSKGSSGGSSSSHHPAAEDRTFVLWR